LTDSTAGASPLPPLAVLKLVDPSLPGETASWQECYEEVR
jgi:hypothetical protein